MKIKNAESEPAIVLDRDERRVLMRILDAAEKIKEREDERRLLARDLNDILRELMV